MVKKNLASGPVLVTGAAGFIGSHLTRRLMESGHRVVALDDLSGGFRDNLPADADFVEASVLDQDRLTKLFEKHKFRHVYHLAAYAAEGLSHFIRKFNYSNNVLGSMNLINLSVCHGVERFVFTSSIAVYGSNQVPMHERMAPSPEDPYGIAKYAVELDLRAAHELFGLQYTVFRPHNVYGEYQNIGDRYRNVIGIFMNQLALGQPLTIFGDGQQQRAFSYIDDVVWPMVACLDMPETACDVFNVGSDEPYTVNVLAEAVMDAMGVKGKIRNLAARKEVIIAYSDHGKLRAVFKDMPKPVPLTEGLKKMATWAKRQKPRKTKLSLELEIEKNLPDSWRDVVTR